MLLASHKVFSVLSWCVRTRSVAVTWYDPCITQSSFPKTLIIGFSLIGVPPKMGNYPCEVENIHSPAKLTTPFQSRTVTSAVSSQVTLCLNTIVSLQSFTASGSYELSAPSSESTPSLRRKDWI